MIGGNENGNVSRWSHLLPNLMQILGWLDLIQNWGMTKVLQKLWEYLYSGTRSLGAHWAPTSGWAPLSLSTLSFAPFKRSGRVRGAPYQERMCLFGHCQNSDLIPPLLPFLGHLWHIFFTKTEKILKTLILTLGINIYYGQKWFWYGILMEIMENIDEILWKWFIFIEIQFTMFEKYSRL